MTDADRLDAIFNRLGKIDRDLASHSAHMTGELARVGDKITDLDERVRIQNGRVTKAEHRLHEIETQQRIKHSHETEDAEQSAVISARVWAALTGSFLVILGAVIGYAL
jgi:hypothetical protein